MKTKPSWVFPKGDSPYLRPKPKKAKKIKKIKRPNVSKLHKKLWPTTASMIKEFNRRGLGVYNLNYIFMYKPMEEGTLTYESDVQPFNKNPK